jgi:ferredoxin-type protein NapG
MDGDAPSSRRNFFRNLVQKSAETAAKTVAERLPKRRRPPGALSEPAFMTACDRCHKCVAACPEHAIFTLNMDAGISVNTPVMVPEERPCLMCEGFPCAAACPTGALKVPEEETVRLGTVRLNPAHCFVFRGPECGACAGLCPTESLAEDPPLKLVMRKPQIDSDSCVGCGRCIEACPTIPKAIEMVPI